MAALVVLGHNQIQDLIMSFRIRIGGNIKINIGICFRAQKSPFSEGLPVLFFAMYALSLLGDRFQEQSQSHTTRHYYR